jgi:hypothetical protein
MLFNVISLDGNIAIVCEKCVKKVDNRSKVVEANLELDAAIRVTVQDADVAICPHGEAEAGVRVTDISPLAGLTSLTNLDLTGQPVTDLRPLAGLTELTKLDLGNKKSEQ